MGLLVVPLLELHLWRRAEIVLNSVTGSSSSNYRVPPQVVLMPGASMLKRLWCLFRRKFCPEWTVTQGVWELNDGHLCANMIDHFTPPAFFKTVRKMEHEQLFTEWSISLAEEKNVLLEVSGLEVTENSLRGEVASAKDHNVLLEQECNSLKLKVTGLESTTYAEESHELFEALRNVLLRS
ncbi:hypothetical protein Tco_0247560 [Tanacetum coccineum]